MLEFKGSSRIFLVASTVILAACGGNEKTSVAASEEKAAPAAVSAAEDPATGARDQAAPELGATADDAGWGEPLADPTLYYGLYAHPDRPDRTWFVAEAKRPIWAEQAPEIPPGHLEIGAMFGDVAPWPMRTVSETRFEQKSPSEYQPEPIRIEFELDEEGSAVAMVFLGDSPPEAERLVRTGDLPEEWR